MSWGFLTRNFGWKLGSLALSVALWYSIAGEAELVTTHAAPVLYKNLPAGLLIGPDAVDVVRLELRGPASRLSQASLADVEVTVDLASVAGPGERTFTLSGADVHLPEAVVFQHAVPSQLRMEFSRRKMKNVPVEIRLAAAPPAGFAVVKQEVEPQTIQIAGPEARVNAIATARTDAIDLSGVTGAAEFRVNTYVADPQVSLASAPAVRVRFTVEKRENMGGKRER